MTNAFTPDFWLLSDDGLAKKLRTARQSAGLSGQQLAAATGIQAAKISRLERGQRVPTKDDIELWATATDLDDAGRAELLALLDEYHSIRTDFELRMQYGQRGIQNEYNELFERTTHFRFLATSQVPGFLQRPDYARQILTEMAGMHQAPDDVDAAVAARLRRANSLNDLTKRFEIILTEAVLRSVLCDPEAMRTQLRRLTMLTDLPNVRFGIIPQGVRIRTATQHSFGMYDDRVIVETFFGEENYGGKVADKAVKVMNLLWEDAVEGDAANNLIFEAMADLPH